MYQKVQIRNEVVGRQRTKKSRVGRREEADLVKKQQAGIDLFAVEAVDETVLLRVPCAGKYFATEPGSMSAPILVAVGEAEHAGDLAEPVAGGPTHDARMRVGPTSLTKLPQPRIRFERGPCRP